MWGDHRRYFSSALAFIGEKDTRNISWSNIQKGFSKIKSKGYNIKIIHSSVIVDGQGTVVSVEINGSLKFACLAAIGKFKELYLSVI